MSRLLCQCGCGQVAPVAKKTVSRLGHVKGQPIRFRVGHGRRKHPHGHRVDPESGCWIWQAHLDVWGYGRVWRDGRKIQAHYAYYEDKYGPVPRRRQLHHRCETPACVNPDHMEVLTPAEHRRRHSKLTARAVGEIKDLCTQGWVQGDIANAYGVSQPVVSAIHRKEVWA